jgi:hypothetical protein
MMESGARVDQTAGGGAREDSDLPLGLRRNAFCPTVEQMQALARASGPVSTIQFGTFDPADVISFFAPDADDEGRVH